MILKCEKCKKESLFGIDPGAYLIVDFENKRLTFNCPKCNHVNEIRLDIFAKPTNNESKLPNIGLARG